MNAKKWTIGILLLIGLLVGSLGAGALLAGKPGRAAAAPAAQTSGTCLDEDGDAEAAETADLDDVEEELQCSPQDENEADETEGAEIEDGQEDAAEDAGDEIAPTSTGITADQAQAIAESANPGATTLAVEFDREKGHDLWEVELGNGLDVKVDAGSGQIILTETRD